MSSEKFIEIGNKHATCRIYKIATKERTSSDDREAKQVEITEMKKNVCNAKETLKTATARLRKHYNLLTKCRRVLITKRERIH